MALISCPECQHQVSDAATACPACGHPMVNVPKQTAPSLSRATASAQAHGTAKPTANVPASKVGLGCLSIFGFAMIMGAANAVAAAAPAFGYLTLLLVVGTIGGMAANRPPALRTFVKNHKGVTGAVLVAVLLGSFAGIGEASKRKADEVAEAARKESERVSAERRAAEQRARDEQLRQGAEQAATRIRELAAQVRTTVESSQWDAVPQALGALSGAADPYANLADAPDSTRNAIAIAKEAIAYADTATGTRDTVVSAARQIDDAQSQYDAGEYVKASDLADQALAALQGIPEANYRYVPDRAQVLARANSIMKRVQPKAAAQRKKLEKEAAKERERQAIAGAMAALCGAEEPLRSSWDGSYVAAERYIEKNAHDPDSVDMESCTKALMTDKCWKTTCAYRAKNGFGALIRTANTFYIGRDNTVIGAD